MLICNVLRRKDRPQLTLNFVVQFFLLALCGYVLYKVVSY
jgi:urea transporter